MSRLATAVLAAVLVCVGCAGGNTPPASNPSTDPSNPAAAEAPAPPQSRVLTVEEGLPPPSAAPGGDTPASSAPVHDHHQSDMPGMNMDPAGEAGHDATPKEAAGKKAAPTYTCPMHPEVTSAGPGRCPKCGMTLVPRKASDSGGGHAH